MRRKYIKKKSFSKKKKQIRNGHVSTSKAYAVTKRTTTNAQQALSFFFFLVKLSPH